MSSFIKKRIKPFKKSTRSVFFFPKKRKKLSTRKITPAISGGFFKPQNKTAFWLFLLTMGLTAAGLIMVYNASSFEAFQVFSDKFYYLRNQATWAALGLILLIFFSNFSYHRLKPMAMTLMVINCFLLFAVLIPGVGIQILGARRWINLGVFSFQPSEFLKITLCIYLTAWLEKNKSFWSFIGTVFLLLFLIVMQPDLGTGIVITTTALCVYFISGAEVKNLLLFIVLGLVLGGFFVFSSQYRLNRIMTFVNPTDDPLGKSYHVRQIQIALGSGGIFGLGLGQSRQKYRYLPEATTDSIFAVIAEETGFLGSSILIISFLLFFFLGFKIARRAKSRFGIILGSGLTAWIAIQALINFGTMVSLLPLTGVPLPFISYGGSSLLAAMISVGILINIAKNRA